jgi:hypothetical protein
MCYWYFLKLTILGDDGSESASESSKNSQEEGKSTLLKDIEKEYNQIDVGISEINLDDEFLDSPNKPSEHK